jgi:hypothetical protein
VALSPPTDHDLPFSKLAESVEAGRVLSRRGGVSQSIKTWKVSSDPDVPGQEE